MESKINEVYNRAAIAYRERYDSIPPRVEDVDRTLAYVPKSNPAVLEIGCAYGREAKYILTKTNQYLGLDIAEKYIEMATQEVPEGKFACVDVIKYTFPASLDVVFAFASLLHNPKEDVAVVLQRVGKSLKSGGVLFLSLKRRSQYETAVETDDLASRRFYYYTHQTILDIVPTELVEVFYDEQSRKEEWFTMILQKK